MSAPIFNEESKSSGALQGSNAFGNTVVIDASSPEAPVLPSGKFATDATFLQQGDDLLLTGADGTTVVVRDYFLTDTPPDLMTPEGGRLTPEIVSSFTPPEAVGQYAQVGDSSAAPVGQAVSAVGQVFAVRTNGVREAINAGDAIYQGDVIETADGGAVDVLFVDKTTFALGSDARLSVDKLVFDPDTQHGQSSFSILKGMFVFSSGEIAKINPLDMTVKTTVATIGIRGTKVAGEVKPAGEESKFTILEGEIVVVTDEGFVVLSDPNETSFVKGFNAPPSDAVLFSEGEISGFYSDVKSISNGFYNSGSNADKETKNETGAGSENAESEVDLEKAAEALSDLAPAAGGDSAGEDVVEAAGTEFEDAPVDDIAEGADFETEITDGFEAEEFSSPAQVANTQTGGTQNGNDNDQGPIETPAVDTTNVPTAGDDTLQGGAGNDTIDGGAGDDSIDGNDGDDLLIGSDGDDVIDGGDGDDLLVAATGQGDDSYEGGAGTDTISFTSATESVSVDLEAGTASGLDIDTDTITGVENVVGGAGNDFIRGNAGDNVLSGGAGDDTIDGAAGDDLLRGGTGDDEYHVTLGQGSDRIEDSDGGADQIVVTGVGPGLAEFEGTSRDGDDLIISLGEDEITVANHFGAGTVETITFDFGDNESSSFTLARGLIGNDADGIISGTDAGETLIGGGGGDIVFGFGGDDTGIVTLDGVADFYDGGLGNDTLIVNLSVDDFSDPAIAADLLALRTFVAETADANASSGSVGNFDALGLDVANWENLEIFVDGETADLDASTPEIGVSPVVGNEDSTIELNIAAILGDTDGSEILAVTVSEIPDGATLSAGTVNDDGSVSLTATQLTGLTVTPATNDDSDFVLNISATATETSTGLTATTTAILPVTVAPVADAPDVAVSRAAGDEDSAIDLEIAAVLNDTDGSEILALTISGIPEGASLSAGTVNEDGSVSLSAEQLAGLQVTPAENSDEDFTLNITATATEISSGATATTSATLPVTVVPIADAPEISETASQVTQAEPVTVAHSLTTEIEVNGVAGADLELTNDHAVTVTFLGESAGYRNTVGYYKIADDGELTDAKLIWENASAVRSGGDLVPGETSVTLDLEAGDRFAFFIVANGDRRNNFDNFGEGSFEFRDSEAAATVDSDNPSLFFVGTNGNEQQIKGNIFHTAEADGAIQLNADGLSHTISSIDETTGGLTIGFEDLPNLGDRDFNDLIIRTDFDDALGETLAPVAIAAEIDLNDVDSTALSEATVEFLTGFGTDDFLQIGSLEDLGIAVTEHGLDQTDGIYKLVLSGAASLDAYEAALATVEFGNASNAVEAGVREFGISVTDVDGAESEVVTTSVTVQSANTVAGSSENDVLSGSAGNDIIDGDAGDDVISGNGGKDALRGGEGDDRLSVGDDGFVLVDGGTGTDTVSIDFALDFGAVADNAVRGIESFDLGGATEAALTIGVDDVLAITDGVNALTGSENTLVVRRDGNEDVTVVGEEWEISEDTLETDEEELGESYTVYHDSTSGATVYVENAALA